ncbi:MAG TPA: hypothetical protein VMT32_06705 [Bryobacteraceae bacterium]|nr:hypothetical protein [Bryobacteraceae bacterium]
MTWMTHPFTQCALVVTALAFALDLVRTVKVRVRGRARQAGRVSDSEILALKQRLEELAARQPVTQPSAAAADDTGPAGEFRPGMNLSRRSQALRLFRRGETPEQISSSLRMPAGEVRLLLKVHRLVMERAVGGPVRPDLKSATESADKRSSAGTAARRTSKPI